MIDAFVEGVRSIGQACHLVILVPVATMVVAARGRWEATVGAVAGMIVGGWIFVTRWYVPGELALRGSAVVVIALLAALAIAATTLAARRGLRWTAPGATPIGVGAVAAIGAAIVTQWWRPCVGRELGDILTEAPDQPFAQLPATVGFMAGVATPVVLLGLALRVWPPSTDAGRRAGLVAASLGAVLAGSVLAGRHGEIVARLVEWSQ